VTDVRQEKVVGAVADKRGGVDEQLVRQLTERARAEGLQLTGEGGLLGRLTKMVVESALQGEMDDHLGYGKHDPVGRNGENSRNGKRAKTLLTEAGPVEIEVPRDRESSFEPKMVAKRQRRLSGVDDLVISLSAKGLTHGEISAHLAEIYGAEVSKQTISTITAGSSTFLQFDQDIRTVICTTNAIESINARIRRAVNARGHFPNVQALKCVYLAIMSLGPTGKGRKRWSNRWKAALNAFEITFDGRLSAGRN
jgi:transposase-like protein